MRRCLTVLGIVLFSATIGLAGFVSAFVSVDYLQPTAYAQGSCSLAQPAFCETFDAPSPLGAGTRSGDLNGVLWGVSRATSNDNPSQGAIYTWAAATRSTCGSSQTVGPPRDVAICNGQLVESVNDNGGQTDLAMYPRQPFDIAGRTGTVTFDVNSDSQGPHAAWPTFEYTDQPVPAPYGQASALFNTPRNSFGFSLATPNCNGDPNLNGIDQMWTSSSYQFAEQGFTTTGCIHRPTTATQLNHFEVRISQSHVEVWGTDPGVSNLHQLAVGDFSIPLSRGLIWIEDVHYNANKFNSQANHTFVWDNVGFDGPVLPRDLGFDVLDATHNGSSGGNIGYLVPTAGTLTLQIPNVNSVKNASAALLEFNFWPHDQDFFLYAVNGHPAHIQPWSFGSNGFVWGSQTIAMPVPLNELQDGTNTVVLSSTDTVNGGVSIANIDLILAGAGGTTSGDISASPTPSSTSTSTATPTPIRTSSPTATPTSTSIPTSTATTQATATPTSILDAPRFDLSARANPTSVARGQPVALSTWFTSSVSLSGLVDIEVISVATGQRVFQYWDDNENFAKGQARNYTRTWVVPNDAATGTYVIRLGAFTPGWATLISWTDAARFTVY